MKVGIYIRVSTEQQIENYSIPLQLERLKAYCQSKGWTNITEYIDAGYTGSNIDRPALTGLLDNLDRIDAVVVYRLDRLSRSQKDTLYLIEERFLPKNVEFISVSETIDTTTPFGRAMIGILSVFAQLERETITERMRSGRYKLAKDEGYWAGGADANPAGYTRKEKGRLEVNEEGEMVTRIFKEYLLLKSIGKIQTKFKKEGIPVWRYSRYSRLLRNRLYLGEVSFGGEWFKGSHKPLTDIGTFDQVQALLEVNKGKNYGKIKKMYLSGIIECGKCGQNMTTWTSTGGKRVYQYYICRARRFPAEYPKKCMNKNWRQDKLDDVIFDAIENANINDFSKTGSIKKVNYSKLLNNIDKKIKKTLDLYVDGIMSKEALDNKINELSMAKKELEDQQKNYNLNIKKDVIDLLNLDRINIREASHDERATIIRALIKKVILTDNDVEIIWNVD